MPRQHPGRASSASGRSLQQRLADAESAALFRPLFDDAIAKHNVPPGQLTLHADRGGPMKARATALLLADLGVTRSHNRPHTSNVSVAARPFFRGGCWVWLVCLRQGASS